MKNITVRGDSYRVRVFHEGQYKTGTFDTLAAAQIWRDRIKANNETDPDKKIILETQVVNQEAISVTLQYALERYAMEITPHKKGASVERTRINKINRLNLARKSIYLFGPDDLAMLLSNIGGSENNRRIYTSLISHLYKTANRLWKMNVRNPVQVN